jgi:hypothetical protein
LLGLPSHVLLFLLSNRLLEKPRDGLAVDGLELRHGPQDRGVDQERGGVVAGDLIQPQASQRGQICSQGTSPFSLRAGMAHSRLCRSLHIGSGS